MSKIRIGFDTRDLFFAQTGTRTFTEELLWEIKSDPEVELVELAPKRATKPKGFFSKALVHFAFIIWKTFTLPLLARKNRVDHLICPDYVAPFLFLGKIKTYPVFHGCNIWELPKNYNRIWRFYFTILAIYGQKRAEKIITVSEFSKSKIISVLGINKDKIEVIPLGPKRTGSERYRSEKAPSKYSFDYILHVGVLDKRKNLPNLVRAFGEIKEKNIHLVLVGGRPSKKSMDSTSEISDAILRSGLEHRVHLTGYVPDQELSGYYQNARAYVFPSSYEGFGIPVLEAYSYGLPLIASSEGSLPEVVRGGGLLFDPSSEQEITDKINEILTIDEFQSHKLRQEQAKVLAWYNWHNSWKTLKKTIKNAS
ncbi:glycosyltransferase family 4 protein [Belliella marina]|uniref:Glycosyltransferase family 4 protein n=1 Tax=Belliella marina TaxID=1644146 RepID=A0ABW4VJW2_9BACT